MIFWESRVGDGNVDIHLPTTILSDLKICVLLYLTGIMRFQSAILMTLFVTSSVSASTYGLGARVEGDRLLINDTLLERAKSTGLVNRTIEFQYPVPKSISYIEIEANTNAYALFGLSPDRVLEGSVVATHSPELEVKIRVFVVDEKDAPPNFHPALLPNKKLESMVIPDQYGDDDEFYEDDYDDENVLSLGERQPDDVLLYETYQYSEDSKKPENHSITFYYIDSNFVTFAEFATIGTETASATFSQVSDHSIKAIIYDEDVKGLVVKIRLFGYTPDKKSTSFRPMLPSASNEPGQKDCPTVELLQDSASKLNLHVFLIIFISFTVCAAHLLA